MRDDWFDHRHPLTGTPVGDKEEWTFWDFHLLDVLQTIEDYTMASGLLVWENEDPATVVIAQSYTDKFDEAVEAKTQSKNYKPKPGVKFRPVVTSRRSDKSVWTFRDWIEEKAKEAGN